jgi:hypothetical protein
MQNVHTYLWLSVLEHVEATHGNAGSTKQMTKFNIDVPVNPGPVFMPVSHWRLGELSDTVEPSCTIVETDLDSLYLMTTSIVGIAGDAIGMALLDIRELNTLTMARFGYDWVQVLLVACSVWVAEEGFGKLAIFLGHKGWLGVH